ncbi:MAG: methyltransferase domain-containing protein [Bacteroidia bacterium]|nr:methyltransferase domain-containing protein [Bacteroidia bacterium]
MKAGLDENYWNNRYINNDFGWDVGEVSTPLKEYIDQLANHELRILIPGAGNAYEAEYLSNKGFKNVFVCDLAQEPLSNLKKRCPAIADSQLIHGNFFDLEQSFDLVLEQTFFCAINPTLRKSYFEKMHRILKPGGKLVGVMFDAPMNTDTPPFGGSAQEYETYFAGLFTKHTYEACHNSIKPRAGREIFVNLRRI